MEQKDYGLYTFRFDAWRKKSYSEIDNSVNNPNVIAQLQIKDKVKMYAVSPSVAILMNDGTVKRKVIMSKAYSPEDLIKETFENIVLFSIQLVILDYSFKELPSYIVRGIFDMDLSQVDTEKDPTIEFLIENKL